MVKNIESADISMVSTGDDILIVFNNEYVSKSHKQIDRSIEPTDNIRVGLRAYNFRPVINQRTRYQNIAYWGVENLRHRTAMMIDFIHNLTSL